MGKFHKNEKISDSLRYDKCGEKEHNKRSCRTNMKRRSSETSPTYGTGPTSRAGLASTRRPKNKSESTNTNIIEVTREKVGKGVHSHRREKLQ
ncbi:unnamed protein product, partial [Ilex paraguariensis]